MFRSGRLLRLLVSRGRVRFHRRDFARNGARKPLGSRLVGTYVSSHFRLEAGEVERYIQRKGMVTKDTVEHVIVRECPLCSKPTRGKADNLFKLFIKKLDGRFFCHRCGSGGSWFDLKRRLGDAPGISQLSQEKADPSTPMSTSSAAETPRPSLCDVLSMSRALLEEEKFPNVLQYLTEKRGLGMAVLREYLVGATHRGFYLPSSSTAPESAPLRPTLLDCVAFPMIRGEGNGLFPVRTKLRAIADKSRQILDPKGGGWCLFGAHTVAPGTTSLVVTEGEFDAMAVRQATGAAAVSVPNGCRSLPVELLPWLEQFQRIYLWMDEDGPGQEGAERMAAKLGYGRCYIVRTSDGKPKEEVTGETSAKDANEALLLGWNLSKALSSASPLPHEQILRFEDLRSALFHELTHPAVISGTPWRVLPGLQELLKGHRPGELSIVTGPTGAGKTTLLSQISLDLAAQGIPTLWGSFEVKNVRLIKRMMQQYLGQSLEGVSFSEMEAAAEAFGELPLFFLRFFGSSDVDAVLDAMEYAVYAHDVTHIVLDNLQFMMNGAIGSRGSARGFDRFDAQEAALDKFRRFASLRNVHVSLVIHPRKEAEGTALNLSSVFGTAKATQEADNVMILQCGPDGRNKRLDVRKNRFDGATGSVSLEFHAPSQGYFQRGAGWPGPMAALPQPSSQQKGPRPFFPSLDTLHTGQVAVPAKEELQDAGASRDWLHWASSVDDASAETWPEPAASGERVTEEEVERTDVTRDARRQSPAHLDPGRPTRLGHAGMDPMASPWLPWTTAVAGAAAQEPSSAKPRIVVSTGGAEDHQQPRGRQDSFTKVRTATAEKKQFTGSAWPDEDILTK